MPTCAQCEGTGYNVSTVSSSTHPKGYRETRYPCYACNGKGYYGRGRSPERRDPALTFRMDDGAVGCAIAVLLALALCVGYFVRLAWS
jgi:hypothetical protein